MIKEKPKGSTWTDEQWEAICKDGTNIIVSAGAGSGKTAVLTERVIQKLLNGIRIDQLLILTFTKAAAAEMKERIRDAIKKKNELKEQLNYIDTAYITTFDSFALSVVKKYHYLLNVRPDISIIDSSVVDLKKKELLDKIFETYYQKEEPSFLKMIDTFCIKDDQDIKNYILGMFYKLDLRIDKKEYLNTYLDTYFQKGKITNDINTFVSFLKKIINEISFDIETLYSYDAEYAAKVEEVILPLLNATTYEEILYNLNIKLPIVPRNSEEELKKAKESLNEKLKNLKSLVCYESEAEIEETIYLTKDTIAIIIDILTKLDQEIFNYKFQEDKYEFNDIALLSIKILQENSFVREEMKNKFQEIMIDEYQDTNDLQEAFIQMIANHNVYMVGDIKQSIYRFRNANPYLFKEKYTNYGQGLDGYKIDLNKNFRSREEVLDDINVVFNLIMDEDCGGADYITSHQMVFGNKKYSNEGATSQNNHMEYYYYPYDKTGEYKKEELEAFIIADDIINKISSHYQVFDKKTSSLRDANYQDFVILIDRTKDFDLYKKIFTYKKIPLTLYKEEKMNEEDDILVLKNLLSFIIKVKEKNIDKKFKYLYISLMRSFLYEETDENIFKIFKENTFKETELYQKSLQISKKLDNISISSLLEIIIEEFNYLKKLIHLGNVGSGLIRIDKIKETASNLSSLGYDCYDFSNYLEQLLENNYEIKYMGKNDYSNAVRIMTIHKSKGLEYSVCYFSGLYNDFNIRELKERFLYSKDYGIIVPYFKEGIGQTIYKDLLKEKYIEEEISEKIRLFYVALTRAREKMILLLPKREEESNSYSSLVPLSVRNKYRSLEDVLVSIECILKNYSKDIDLEKIGLSKEYNAVKLANYSDNIPPSSEKIQLLNFEFNYNTIQEESFSKKTNELISPKNRSDMDLGLKVHEYLEYLDFKNPDFDTIEDNFIKEKIKSFLKQDLLKNLNNANIYKEYEFIYEQDSKKYHGIIDLMIEYDDRIDIIDYKLKNILDNNYLKQLNGYKNYIQTKSNKQVYIYLYSVLDNEFKQII